MTRVFSILIGLGMGFSLSRIGFSNPAAVRAMFTLSEARLILTFAFAVVLLVVAFRVLPKAYTQRLPSQPMQRGTIVGGLLFGAGWAVCGACPSIALVQLGEGRVPALFTLAGIVIGNIAFALLDRHVLRWQRSGCSR